MVANGSFQVHELDRGTVIAAVVVSTLKNQNVGQMTPSTINPADLQTQPPRLHRDELHRPQLFRSD